MFWHRYHATILSLKDAKIFRNKICTVADLLIINSSLDQDDMAYEVGEGSSAPTSDPKASLIASRRSVRRMVCITVILTIFLLLAVAAIAVGLLFYFKILDSSILPGPSALPNNNYKDGGMSYDFQTKQVVRVISNRTYVVNTIGGSIQGPAIHVKRGDKLSVTVTNELTDSGLSIHWHGLDMRGHQVYDGVFGLTQCAIGPGESYVYQFTVDEHPGTNWYHTHNEVNPSGQDFIQGPLIVHESDAIIPSASEDSYQYGNERILFYQDLYPNYLGFDYPLLTGEGDTKYSDRSLEGNDIGSGLFSWVSGILNGEEQYEVKVENGEHRFRIINGGSQFPYFFSIDGYKLKVVASDGSPVEPYETDVIHISVAERYDILVNFNITTETDNVWIRAMTLSEHQEKGILSVLRIRRNDSIPFDTDLPPNKDKNMKEYMQKASILNCKWFEPPFDYNCIPVTDLVPIVKQKLLDSVEYHTVDFLHFRGKGKYVSIDGGILTSNSIPRKPLILASARDEVTNHTNVLSVPTEKSVTIVLRNRAFDNHPMHLHGHHFEVLEIALRDSATCGDDDICPLLDLDTAFSEPIKDLMRRPRQGVLKDTVVMPAGGAVAVRINTDNPGVWFFHCHIHIHLHEGMGFALNEQDYMFSQDSETVPQDYPSCDTTGRLQSLREAICEGEEEIEGEKVTLRYSKPWLCHAVGNRGN